MVNDGSPDDSLERAINCINAIRASRRGLSRTFGHHKALMTGLRTRAARSSFHRCGPRREIRHACDVS
jgi:glycosyltransferase involved in cell wall biosynthesis